MLHTDRQWNYQRVCIRLAANGGARVNTDIIVARPTAGATNLCYRWPLDASPVTQPRSLLQSEANSSRQLRQQSRVDGSPLSDTNPYRRNCRSAYRLVSAQAPYSNGRSDPFSLTVFGNKPHAFQVGVCLLESKPIANPEQGRYKQNVSFRTGHCGPKVPEPRLLLVGSVRCWLKQRG